MSTPPRRFAIVGTSGSGKTTLAARLAEALDVPHIELDSLCHRANWVEAPNDEFRDEVRAAMGDGGWVADGVYDRKLGGMVLESADTVVWLDLPLRLKMTRLWRRTHGRIRNRTELWNGNRESWRNALWGRDSLMIYTLRRHARMPREMAERRADPQLQHLRFVRLRSDADVERYARSLGA